jgi:DNA-binding CsgD family transcriptional regulator
VIHKKPEIKVIVASPEYLIRLGIQALIRHLGFEPDYVEINSLEQLKIESIHYQTYLILHHKLLDKPKQQSLQTIKTKFTGKILVIGNDKVDQLTHQHILLPSDSQKETVEKIQDFFNTAAADETPSENNILSLREIDILKEVALGYSNKEIADRLFISINTVITHRKNITEKLGIKSISGLTVYALLNKLINTEDVTL